MFFKKIKQTVKLNKKYALAFYLDEGGNKQVINFTINDESDINEIFDKGRLYTNSIVIPSNRIIKIVLSN